MKYQHLYPSVWDEQELEETKKTLEDKTSKDERQLRSLDSELAAD